MNEIIQAQGRAIQSQADTDGQVIELWLHGKSPHTRAAYQSDLDRFFTEVPRPIREIKLSDLQAFSDSLQALAPSSQARILSTVRSLLSFAHKMGYTAFNVGTAVNPPKIRGTLAERILSERDVRLMVRLEPDGRNRAILSLLYVAGVRVSELCGLKWKDLQPRGRAGQITVFGKGGKTRGVLVPVAMWKAIQALQGKAAAGDPVFRSKKGGSLSRQQVFRIVRRAAERAGFKAAPHWLRHSHASHAIDHGAPITLVRDTLGHSNLATTSMYSHARPGESSARYIQRDLFQEEAT